MPYGTLALTIADGRNLKDQDLFGKMDPYVNFQLAAGANVRSKWRCKTHNGGGKNPSWNDRHNFDVVEGDDRIQAQVYDEDSASDDLIGSTSIDLNTVFQRGMRDEWFPLQACCSCMRPSFMLIFPIRPRVAGPPARFASSFSSLRPVANQPQCPAPCQATCVLQPTVPLPLMEVTFNPRALAWKFVYFETRFHLVCSTRRIPSSRRIWRASCLRRSPPCLRRISCCSF